MGGPVRDAAAVVCPRDQLSMPAEEGIGRDQGVPVTASPSPEALGLCGQAPALGVGEPETARTELLSEDAILFVDAGQSTDSELRAWGVAHAPLWAALRARTFAVHVVAVGTGAAAADHAAPVLKRWTQDGNGQGAADPAGPTKADPDIRQEIARLEKAITAGNRELLRAAGGFDTAADRLEWLQQLPDGTPTKATARGAIDRFTIWPTVRLTALSG